VELNLNYHHLLYFYEVARAGSIVAASQRLHVSQPAISTQLRTLEESLGEKLLTRSGRGLVLTDTGRVAYRYADEIFSLGRELRTHLAGKPATLAERLVVGIIHSMPKLVVFRLLQPALHLDHPVRLECREDSPDRLLAGLALHAIDVVLADQPIATTGNVHAVTHLLGESGVSFFAVPGLADKLRPGFPGSLDGAPFLLPARHAAMRWALEEWFEREQVKPVIVGEFDDSALMKVFGEHGAGVFAGPAAMEQEIRAQFGVEVVQHAKGLRERFYAITVERRVEHPAVTAILAAARTTFGQVDV
jgi:LysR family transcriptional activator of nhaA